jgi:hypothetical protein
VDFRDAMADKQFQRDVPINEGVFAAMHESEIGSYRRNQTVIQCRLLGIDRTSSRNGQINADDPEQTFPGRM